MMTAKWTLAGIAMMQWLCFQIAAGLAFSQASSPWEVPPDFVPSPRPAQPPAQGTVGPITFSEPEFPFNTIVNGLVVNSIGGAPLAAPLSFSFTSIDARVLGGPLMTAYVQAPIIEGDATGTLSIDFGLDVTRVALGFAQSCPPPANPYVTVTALDSGGGAVGSTQVTAQDFGYFFAENQVNFTPGSPFRSVNISFDTANGRCMRFAVDNLTFDELAVPTMGAVGLAILALFLLAAGMGLVKRRRVADV